jgi:two-component system OmpR family sensor kinase
VLRRTPLRVKLVAAVLALVAAALVVISVGSAVALRSYLLDRADADLDAAAERALQEPLLGAPQFLPLPSEYFVTVMDGRGQVYRSTDTGRELVYYYGGRFEPDDLARWPSSADEVQRRLNEPYTARSRDGKTRWRMLVTTGDGLFVTVGRNLDDVDKSVVRLVWIDVLVGGIVLILLASLGAAIVRTSLRPLVEIERTAAAIADGDLTRRVPDPEPGTAEPETELGRLSRTLNAMLTQIEAAFTARAASESAARAAESVARDAAEAARLSEARALRSEGRMRQFVADASHELRTPLTTIRGFAELYRHGAAASAADGARLVRRIEDEAARMGLLVEDLLLLARLDRERPLDLAPVELPVLAADAVQAARATAPERAIALEVPAGADRLVVLGDDARLRQVIGNLMTNALRHTPPDAAVTVRLSEGPGDTADLEVIDTGPGLPPEQAERVFERFYRVAAARTRAAAGASGTGLGLAIVAAIVAAHRGSVDVRSESGSGAAFRVRLPLAPVEADTEIDADAQIDAGTPGDIGTPGDAGTQADTQIDTDTDVDTDTQLTRSPVTGPA